jgi:hypothetical protein
VRFNVQGFSMGGRSRSRRLLDVPVVTHLFDGYLQCWYVDPNAAETTR